MINVFDKKKTTDELIKMIATKKMQIINEFLVCMKKASVDCNIHGSELGCYTFPANIGKTKVVTNNLKADNITNIGTKTMTSKISVIEIKHLNKQFIFVRHTSELFDYALYKKTGVLKKVGVVKKLTDTNQFEFRL